VNLAYKRSKGLQGSADVRSLHLLERVANSPSVLSLALIAALFAFDRPLGGDQLSFVCVIL
jgi:hypothetical protein